MQFIKINGRCLYINLNPVIVDVEWEVIPVGPYEIAIRQIANHAKGASK